MSLLCLTHLCCCRELDVVVTVDNLARSCPRFWSSDELKRSCQAGDWLILDRDTVAKVPGAGVKMAWHVHYAIIPMPGMLHNTSCHSLLLTHSDPFVPLQLSASVSAGAVALAA